MGRGSRPVVTAAGPWLLLDTATSQTVVAIGEGHAVRVAVAWEAGRRHGETLLAALDGALRGEGLAAADLAAVIVGTGPGAFTGLRVGLATAKTLAHELRRPLVGVATAGALALSAALSEPGLGGGVVVVVQPAGPHDRTVTRVTLPPRSEPLVAAPVLVPAGGPVPMEAGATIVAVDLAVGPGITRPMVERGVTARAGLAAGLLQAGGAALAAGRTDDPATLVPLYVSLPRGVPAATGAMAWSPDLR